MKVIRYILSALSMGVVLAGCSAILEDDTAPAGKEIRFTATVGSYEVKATDTAFETGDVVGLFSYGETVGAWNLPLSWDGARFQPGQPLFWGPAAGTRSFAAYYPYDAEVNSSSLLFTVNPDQTTHALFTASDLMTASSYNVPSGSDVVLHFTHRLSKLVISIDNQIQEEIADVYVSNVYGTAELDVNDYYYNRLTVSGELGTIKAGKVREATGAVVWTAIVPPQSGEPAILVTTASGRQYNCTPESDVSFISGCRYRVRITLGPDMISTDFTTEVTEWTDNKDLMFGSSSWALIGSFVDWAYDYHMSTEQGSGIYDVYFDFEPDYEFKFRRNGSWDFNYGLGDPGTVFLAEEGTYTLTRDGGNIKMANPGMWHVILDVKAETVTFEPFGSPDDNTIWQGAFFDDGWMGMDALAWGNFDWSWVEPGTILHLDIAPIDDDPCLLRVAKGDWSPLSGLPEYFENPGNVVEVELTEERLSELVNEGGLVIFGDGFILYRIALVSPGGGGEQEVSIVIDGNDDDWSTINEAYLFYSYDSGLSQYPALSMMKAYADSEKLYIYYELNPDYQSSGSLAFDLFINADDNVTTGQNNYLWLDNGVDYMLEVQLHPGEASEYNEMGLFYHAGEGGSSEWKWKSYGSGVYSNGVLGDAGVEMSIDLSAFPVSDSFSIGLCFMEDWVPVGVLPNSSDLTDTCHIQRFK